jgi:uncharacterized protein YfdQ (DUF2303 family)
MPAPHRKTGLVRVFDTASFLNVLADNRDAGEAVVYVDSNQKEPAISAVMNGHNAGGPGWGDYVVTLDFIKTPAWVRWTGIDGKMLDQQAFCEFLEDNAADVVQPSGAALLELLTKLEITASGGLKSKIDLHSGVVQFAVNTDHIAKVGAEAVSVPQKFGLALAPFQCGKVWAVPARFRYRAREGAVTMGLKLEEIDRLVEAIVADMVATIEKGMPEKAKLVYGRAPMRSGPTMIASPAR